MKLTRHNTKQRDRNGGAKVGGTLGRVKKRRLGRVVLLTAVVWSCRAICYPFRDEIKQHPQNRLKTIKCDVLFTKRSNVCACTNVVMARRQLGNVQPNDINYSPTCLCLHTL